MKLVDAAVDWTKRGKLDEVYCGPSEKVSFLVFCERHFFVLIVSPLFWEIFVLLRKCIIFTAVEF